MVWGLICIQTHGISAKLIMLQKLKRLIFLSISYQDFYKDLSDSGNGQFEMQQRVSIRRNFIEKGLFFE